MPSSRPVAASTTWTGVPPSPRMSVRSAARSRRVQYQPPARRRSSPRSLQLRHQRGGLGAEEREVVVGERELGGGGAQVRGEDVRVVRVEDGGLDGPLEDRLGVVDEVRVQRVVPADHDGERALPGASGAAGLLPQRRPGARVAGQQDRVEAGDVHAEFQRGGGGEAEQAAGVQVALQGPALLGRGSRRGRRRPGPAATASTSASRSWAMRATSSAPRRERTKATVRTPWSDQVGEELGGTRRWRCGGPARRARRTARSAAAPTARRRVRRAARCPR